MEVDRKRLKQLQADIKIASEHDDLIELNMLLKERTELAVRSCGQATDLAMHMSYIHLIQVQRQDHLLQLVSKLEELAQLFNQETNSTTTSTTTATNITVPSVNHQDEYEQCKMKPSNSCTFSDWDAVMLTCFEIIQPSKILYDTDTAVRSLMDNIRRVSRIGINVTELLSAAITTTTTTIANHNNSNSQNHHITTVDVLNNAKKARSLADVDENMFRLSMESKLKQVNISNTNNNIRYSHHPNNNIDKKSTINNISNDYEEALKNQDIARIYTNEKIECELEYLNHIELQATSQLRIALEKGFALLNNLVTQNKLDLMVISSMEVEVEDWFKKVKILQNSEIITTICKEYVTEITLLEEVSVEYIIIIIYIIYNMYM